MQLDNYFNNIWYVHKGNGSFDSMWTSRREARDRKSKLTSAGETGVKVSYVPLTYGSIKRDPHS